MNRWLLTGFVVALFSAAATGRADPPLPETAPVIQRFIERSAISASNELTGAYFFHRTNITDELDRKGRVEKTDLRIYRVTVADGARSKELIQINGREPTERERKEDGERLRRKNEKAQDDETPDRSRQVDAFLTLEILSRYLFEVERREVVNNRRCLVVSFKPAPEERRSGDLIERVLDRIGGTLWIDEEEYELAKAEVRLLERITYWGGIVGVLDRVHIVIDRVRDADGRWRDRQTDARFQGRALTSRIDVWTRDHSSEAQPLPQEPQVAGD